MKKLTVLIMALALVFTLASCGGKKDDDNVDANIPAQTDKVEEGSDTGEATDDEDKDTDKNENENTGDSVTVAVLESVWNSYADDEKFPAMGGDFDVMADGVPGAYSISDAEALDSALGFPADRIGDIDEAASLQHMMNANTFTGASYHMADGTDAKSLAEAIKDNIMNRQWMCGFPETLIIIEADGCLITAFGNGEIIENFKTKALEANEGSELIVEEPIA